MLTIKFSSSALPSPKRFTLKRILLVVAEGVIDIDIFGSSTTLVKDPFVVGTVTSVSYTHLRAHET